MIIENLASTSLSEITTCFNRAFADYIIKFTATEEYLKNRWKGAGVNYNLSFGAFIDDKLVGFIIHGIDERNGKKTAFNVGTGVMPEHRGKKIVKKLYDTAIPILKKNKIEQCRLEVIQKNEKAIKTYRGVGFEEDRELICFAYKNDHNQDEIALNSEIQFKNKNDLMTIDWNTLKTFWDFEPSWENSSSSLLRNEEDYQFIGVFKEDEFVGYAIINPLTGYIPQFAIAKNQRGNGFAKCLFKRLTKISKQLAVINVDKQSQETLNFLKSFGFNEFVSQYEMKKKLI